MLQREIRHHSVTGALTWYIGTDELKREVTPADALAWLFRNLATVMDRVPYEDKDEGGLPPWMTRHYGTNVKLVARRIAAEIADINNQLPEDDHLPLDGP